MSGPSGVASSETAPAPVCASSRSKSSERRGRSRSPDAPHVVASVDGQRLLLVEQLLRPVAHALGLDQQDRARCRAGGRAAGGRRRRATATTTPCRRTPDLRPAAPTARGPTAAAPPARRHARAPRRWEAAHGWGRSSPRPHRASTVGRPPRTPRGDRPRRPRDRCGRDGRRSRGTRRRSSRAPRPRRAPPPGTRVGTLRPPDVPPARRGRPGRPCARTPARSPRRAVPSRCTNARTGATTTDRLTRPTRRRHITRRRRPIVSSEGDTRSKGNVSHAGKYSTASGPRNCPRSRTRRSASASVGTARSSGRRVVTPASAATNTARAASGTATVDRRATTARSAGSSARSGASEARGGGGVVMDSATTTGCQPAPGGLMVGPDPPIGARRRPVS